MQESFGPNEGLYWGKPGEPACEFNGEQAETASLTNCVKTKKMAKGISATDLLYRKQVKVLSHGIRKMMVENSMPKFL